SAGLFSTAGTAGPHRSLRPGEDRARAVFGWVDLWCRLPACSDPQAGSLHHNQLCATQAKTALDPLALANAEEHPPGQEDVAGAGSQGPASWNSSTWLPMRKRCPSVSSTGAVSFSATPLSAPRSSTTRPAPS